MASEIHNLIMAEYESRQSKSRYEIEERTAEVYGKVPQIEAIDDEISISGIHFNKMILKGLISTQEAGTKLKAKLTELRSKKTELLMANGYTRDYLEPKFICSKCKDTGYIYSPEGTEKCSCYKQLAIEYLHANSNLKITEEENFESFNENMYPDACDEARYQTQVTPRQNIIAVKQRCMNFIENFRNSDEKNLFFSGPTGVGKTFLSNCVAYELLKKGRTVIYYTAPVLFDILNEYKVRAFGDSDYEDTAYKNIMNCELLIIDDLGTEAPSASRYAEFLTVLNTRHLRNVTTPCKTIISTNLEARQLYEYYTERVASRIIGSFNMYRLYGEDIRRVKKKNSL